MPVVTARSLVNAAVVGGASTIAFLLMWYWTPVSESLTGSFLGGPPLGRQLIEEVFPVRLVQPSWLSQTDDLIYRWEIAETRAREITVISVWFIIVMIVILRDARMARKDLTRRCS